MSTYILPGKPLEYDNAPEWLEAYMRYRRTILGSAPNTVMSYFKDLREFCQWVQLTKVEQKNIRLEETLRETDITMMPLSPLLEIRKNDIETYLYFCADLLDNGASTRGRKLAAVRSLYDYLVDQQEVLGIDLLGNPASRVKSPKAPKSQPVFLPEDDQQGLLENISGENAERDYAIVLLFLVAGLRVSELCALDVPDIDFKAMTVRIRAGKGNKSRVGYLTPACCDALKTYLTQYRAMIPDLDTAALFVSKRLRKRITTRAVEKLVRKHTIRAELGGKGYTPHKFRHTTATTLAKDPEADLLRIQAVMGHSSPATTEIYTHLNDSDISKAVNRSRLSKLGLAPQTGTEE